ncbi:MAG: ATP synthase F0 subunit B [Deltaproteobacteria bacterium]|nr:ATP synthase F0 subunit B [Deltaproteobacteria bacterium]
MTPAAYKNRKNIVRWLLFMVMLATATEAFGAEASANWRPTYDIVMRWVNFGILIVLFFRYARRPLADFLNGRSRQIQENIKEVEKEKEAIKKRVNELQMERKEGRKHLKQIKDRVISQGKRKKQKIIDDAKKESHLLLESAKQKIGHEITSAREKLQAEMVDRSIELAMQKLPQQMNDQDTQNSLKVYLDGIHSLSQS